MGLTRKWKTYSLFVIAGVVVGLLSMFMSAFKDKGDMYELSAFGTFLILILGIVASCGESQ